jgi:methionyl aminopeptidase
MSINEEVVHGIPSEKKIKEGDIVSLDLGIVYKGYFSDAAITLPVGAIKPSVKRLIRVTRESLWQGIKQAHPGKHLGDISYSIQRHVETNRFSVVRQFVGHGIGLNLQEEPEVPNFGQPHQGMVLKAGMVLAIEPMVNMGSWEVEILDNGWTVVTKDRLPSAHFEHTVAITENGPEVLT